MKGQCAPASQRPPAMTTTVAVATLAGCSMRKMSLTAAVSPESVVNVLYIWMGDHTDISHSQLSLLVQLSPT